MSRNAELPRTRLAALALGVCLCLGGFVAATAQVRNADAVAAASLHKAPLPLLWKVSDQDNALYLLGSFHLLKPGDYPVSPDVDEALEAASAVLFEIHPEEMASPALGMQMVQAALRADGTTLDSDLSAATAARLARWLLDNQARLQPLGLTPAILQAFEPWYAGLVVSLVEMGSQGLEPALGLDHHVAGRAKAAGKPVAGLETGAQQVAFLDGMDPQEQLQLLDEALASSADGKGEIAKLHAAWRRGDADALWQGMAAEMRSAYPALYRRINVERNDAWVPQLEQRLSRPGGDDVLVVVGALHLLGDDGVVEKLRARGYAVERICSACPAGATR